MRKDEAQVTPNPGAKLTQEIILHNMDGGYHRIIHFRGATQLTGTR